jgi:hypothetical protein
VNGSFMKKARFYDLEGVLLRPSRETSLPITPISNDSITQ